jgi:FtsZ-interacting cell division protein YlmF
LLTAILQFTPGDYSSGAAKIGRFSSDGRAIAVNLENLDAKQAARLVDFCSGVAAASGGWIFRPAHRVFL